MEVTFKPLTYPEIDIIIPMMQEFYSIDNYPIDPTLARTLFTEFIENENHGRAWFINIDNTTVGYVILTFVFSFEYKGKIAFLDELYISENARGKGVGKLVLDFIKEQALQLSLKIIYLEIEKHNQNALKLYLNKGFSHHNRDLMKLITG